MDSANTSQGNGNMPNQFQQMLDMMQLMQMFGASPPQAQEPGQQPWHTEAAATESPVFFDDYIYTPELKCLKAAISHLEPRHQRPLALMVKMIEMQRLATTFGTTVMGYTNPQNPNWRQELLVSIREYMPPDKKRQIDWLLQISSMSDMMRMMKEGYGRVHEPGNFI